MSRELLDEDYYVSHGGKIPVKWTAPEVCNYVNPSCIALAVTLKGNSSEKLPPTFIAPNHSPNST